MHIEIFAKGFEMADAIRSHVERRLHFALGRFSGRIERVRVSLTDVNTLRGCLALSDVKDFETALGQIEAFLGTSAPSTKGSAIFARAGGHPFFRALEFRVPVRTALSVDTVPQVYQLMELKDTYHRYVVLIATEERARILEVDVGQVTQELWASHPELRQRVWRGWTREHYQNHRRDRGEKFVKEKIAILDRLMSAEGHSHLILAGSPKITAKISKNLPKRLADKLVDVISASTKDKTSDIVVATLSSFTEHEQRESLRTALLLKEELQRGGLAVAGTGPTLEALRSGQADMLVMASAYKAPPGWTCRPCGATGAARQAALNAERARWVPPTSRRRWRDLQSSTRSKWRFFETAMRYLSLPASAAYSDT